MPCIRALGSGIPYVKKRLPTLPKDLPQKEKDQAKQQVKKLDKDLKDISVSLEPNDKFVGTIFVTLPPYETQWYLYQQSITACFGFNLKVVQDLIRIRPENRKRMADRVYEAAHRKLMALLCKIQKNHAAYKVKSTAWEKYVLKHIWSLEKCFDHISKVWLNATARAYGNHRSNLGEDARYDSCWSDALMDEAKKTGLLGHFLDNSGITKCVMFPPRRKLLQMWMTEEKITAFQNLNAIWIDSNMKIISKWRSIATRMKANEVAME